ncbi:MAG: NADH-quinone oxidoreductase subunit A [Planctomycetes bacterium]|nr:NADH-quinone oxidoreductase subunit A [Planctomycetota bacterium]
MLPLVGYMLLFLVIAVVFVAFHLLIGRFVRPNRPNTEKATIYECGEPTIGSAWIQFDLRFYVVALLFVIFDVEVAFFFPWAVVFGQANAVAQQTSVPETAEERQAYDEHMRQLIPDYPENQLALRKHVAGDEEERHLLEVEVKSNSEGTRSLAWMALFDILVFFGVLLVGFAYLWKRGDLAWVRSVSSEGVAPLPSVVKEEPRQLVGAGTGS